jgi:competence protein ComFC
MRCLSCHKLSWQTFCNHCQKRLLKPSISKREIGSLEVYSFFKYQNIEDLLLTKHTPQGYTIYRALAKQTFRPFIKKFIEEDNREIYIVGIDESVKNGYSHVSLLTQQLEYKNTKVLYAKLMATNPVNYAGKNLQFRLENPRNFQYSGLQNIEVILVDDIITTGTTLQEASRILKQNRVKVLFALTLADAKG